MTLTTLAALGFAGLAGFAALVQLALIAGAPWGALTLAGRWPGALPMRLRPVAALQAALQMAMATAVLVEAGLVALRLPGWCIWASLILTGVSVGLHLVTPSAAERRLWLPILCLMMICGGIVIIA
ncbi:hypothetical protein [Aquicoccus sp. SU-CL01552]|uniref:hypothetical protein n=1 Tax=Aquicoccus sp. SU-CL01552 TaxID=3127656 RepID=UPI00310A8A84